MNANELLCYLRGFAELVDQPTEAQWSALRKEILTAKLVENQIIQVPMYGAGDSIKRSPCNCAGS